MKIERIEKRATKINRTRPRAINKGWGTRGRKRDRGRTARGK